MTTATANTITVPPSLVKEIREAAQSDLSKTAREIADRAERPLPGLDKLFADFDRQRGLLGALAGDQDGEVSVGRLHMWALTDALRGQACALDDARQEALTAHNVPESVEYNARLGDLKVFIADLHALIDGRPKLGGGA